MNDELKITRLQSQIDRLDAVFSDLAREQRRIVARLECLEVEQMADFGKNEMKRINLTILEKLLDRTHRPCATIVTEVAPEDKEKNLPAVIAPMNVVVDKGFSAVSGGGFKSQCALYENLSYQGDAEFDVNTREVMFTLIKTLRIWRRALSIANPILGAVMNGLGKFEMPVGADQVARSIIATFENSVGMILDDAENIDKDDYLFSSRLVPRPNPREEKSGGK